MLIECVKTIEKMGRCHKAYTVVEALIAVMIVVILFGTIYAGISQSDLITRATQENLRATQIMQDKTETIRLYTWYQITNFFPNTATFTNSFNPLNPTNGGVTFMGTLSVTAAPLADNPSYAADLRLVTITVSWTSAGLNYSNKIKTLVSHYGLQGYIP